MKPISTLLLSLLIAAIATTAHAAPKPAKPTPEPAKDTPKAAEAPKPIEAAKTVKAPNEGWKTWSEYYGRPPRYKLQNWTVSDASETFKDHGKSNGKENLTFTLRKSDARPQGTSGGTRVELAWDRWPEQKVEHMMEADVMYEEGTKTCIMQIKSNQNTGGSGAASIYLNIRNNNCLHHSVNERVVILDDKAFGKWHNIKVAYNPVTGQARVWIDNILKFEHIYRDGGIDSAWYFKNGAYWGTAKVHFKNLTFWVNPVKPTKEQIKANEAENARKAAERDTKKPSTPKPRKK